MTSRVVFTTHATISNDDICPRHEAPPAYDDQITMVPVFCGLALALLFLFQSGVLLNQLSTHTTEHQIAK